MQEGHIPHGYGSLLAQLAIGLLQGRHLRQRVRKELQGRAGVDVRGAGWLAGCRDAQRAAEAKGWRVPPWCSPTEATQAPRLLLLCFHSRKLTNPNTKPPAQPPTQPDPNPPSPATNPAPRLVLQDLGAARVPRRGVGHGRHVGARRPGRHGSGAC